MNCTQNLKHMTPVGKYILPVFMAAAMFTVMLSGCSSRQEIFVTGSGAGYGVIDIDVHPMFIEYTKDVLEGISGRQAGPDFRMFDIQKIREAFSAIPGVSLKEVRSVSPGSLKLSMDFSDPGALFPRPAAPGVPRVIDFSRSGNRRILLVHLSSENFHQVAALAGMENSEAAGLFGPQADPYTESGYIEMMEFAMGDYVTDEPIGAILRSRKVTLLIHTDGPVKSVTGGTFSGRTATVEIPLLRLLTLEKPVEIRIEWEAPSSSP